ncbi:hypothetical protein ARC78_07415 [Stenotrophomonas pictorum JCM 9942]|uniref:Uncharacterized protein n=1 Tax=Stenotrophomonas pictorum JCM 9942 TaxID=1236960 RepID=A0A0R0ALW1_9GAMM|nr:hypothetical protein [Stenotrophomonas pictorum]KRG43186.1 hypothetical protein ARC78_07415 [Stenotrophomonas pictorum JCM 9942]
MSYSNLYERCQGLGGEKISRTVLVPLICEAASKPRPKVMLSSLNPEIIRGYFVTAHSEHPFAKFARAPGGSVIVVAREMNYCWKRFVEVKEMMHLFDENSQLVGTAAELESLINEFTAPQPVRSSALQSETSALWMALGVLCPEVKRQEFERVRAQGKISDDEIAERLKIPKRYVSHLFDVRYKRNLEMVLAA